MLVKSFALNIYNSLRGDQYGINQVKLIIDGVNVLTPDKGIAIATDVAGNDNVYCGAKNAIDDNVNTVWASNLRGGGNNYGVVRWAFEFNEPINQAKFLNAKFEISGAYWSSAFLTEFDLQISELSGVIFIDSNWVTIASITLAWQYNMTYRILLNNLNAIYGQDDFSIPLPKTRVELTKKQKTAYYKNIKSRLLDGVYLSITDYIMYLAGSYDKGKTALTCLSQNDFYNSGFSLSKSLALTAYVSTLGNTTVERGYTF